MTGARAAFGFGLLSLAAFAGATARAGEPLVPPGCGRVQMARCQVDLISAIDGGGNGTARPGSNICSGDVVETGPRGRVRWLMDDGLSIELLPETRVAWESPTKLRLEKGGAVIERPMGGPPLAAFEATTGGGEASAWLKGPKAFVGVRGGGGGPSVGLRAIAIKGEVSLASSDGRKIEIEERHEAETGQAPRKLTPRELRKAELALHEKPAKKRPAPAYACDP